MDQTTMTIDEFIIEFQNLPESFAWELVDGYYIRSGRFCPITAVCYNKTGKFHWLGDALRTGENMGLSLGDCKKIITSSDRLYVNYYDPDLRNLRKTLLKSCK